MSAVDTMILVFIQDKLRSPFLDWLMCAVSALGSNGLVWICASIILLLIPRTRMAGASCALSLGTEAILVNLILKPIVARPRPFAVMDITPLVATLPTDWSFPSGHTGAAFAFTAALFASHSKLWKPSLVLSILMACSRLYLAVHYPSDVIAGAMVGIFCGWLGWIMARAAAPVLQRTAMKP